jgi:hypothetical protein
VKRRLPGVAGSFTITALPEYGSQISGIPGILPGSRLRGVRARQARSGPGGAPRANQCRATGLVPVALMLKGLQLWVDGKWEVYWDD